MSDKPPAPQIVPGHVGYAPDYRSTPHPKALPAADVIVWEFVVRSAHEREFEDAYGPGGAWATLFSKSPDFLGTELLHDPLNPRRFLTIDRWRMAEAFLKFREDHAAEYEALDRRCGAWTESETKIGTWTTSRDRLAPGVSL